MRSVRGELKLFNGALILLIIALVTWLLAAVVEWETLVLFWTLALGTFISEDLTCMLAGVMVADGRIGFAFASTACLFGIFLGDILLFLAGRLIGRTILKRAPLKWFITGSDVEKASMWFQQQGMTAILLSRFLPGTRLPTYLAAGFLNTSFLKFTLYFLIAAVVWTPLLVGLSMFLGGQLIESALLTGQSLVWKLVGMLIAFFAIRLLIQLLSFRGRRLLLGRCRRITRWEFWPPWVFYPPVVFYVAYLAIRHRGLTVFTCANPAITEGGFIGESKSAILQGLGRESESRQLIARWRLIEGSLPNLEARIQCANNFMKQHRLDFPVILKPDVGQRGSGVAVIRSSHALRDYLSNSVSADVIIQEYVAGAELGVFYYRYPESTRGHILSITRKEFPFVVGDGNSSLEELILKDGRAVCMARTYFDAQKDRLLGIPAKDECVQLVELGTHCRGSVFRGGADLETDAMRAAIEKLASGFKGFYFGRFDIRTPDISGFQRGQNFKVLELNGVTSEATHIYDPGNSLFTAYGVLFSQWRIAFDIGTQNRELGVKPTPLRVLVALLIKQLGKGERNRTVLRPISTAAKMRTQLASES